MDLLRKCPKCESFVSAYKYGKVKQEKCEYCQYVFLTPEEIEKTYGKNLGLDKVITLLNNSLFRFEQFSKGAISEYEYTDLHDLFTQLFIEVRKNYSLEYCRLIGEYWKLLEQYRYDDDKGEFEGESVYNNEAFVKNCDEVAEIAWHRVEEFVEFSLDDEFEEKKKSIINIYPITRKNKNTANPNHHFENAEWLEETVLEFEAEGKSQNKALELTKELYEKEFDRKPPGKTTILRYMGRAE